MTPRILLFLLVLLVVFGIFKCSSVVFVGSSKGTFTPQPQNKVSPEKAYQLAKPLLPKTFQLRCQKIHKNDDFWCKKEPTDYIVMQGSYYHLTRTAYPYKTIHAYLKYAVLVHINTGEIKEP